MGQTPTPITAPPSGDCDTATDMSADVHRTSTPRANGKFATSSHERLTHRLHRANNEYDDQFIFGFSNSSLPTHSAFPPDAQHEIAFPKRPQASWTIDRLHGNETHLFT